MRRYWVDRSNIEAERVVFSGELFRHIFVVCRQREGNHFEVLLEGGEVHLVEVVEVAKGRAEARILENRRILPLPRPHIRLCLSVPRYPRVDEIVEKAVEMGVHSLQLFVSDFSHIRKPQSLPQGKLQRWERIVRSATQQSGRGELMSILPPLQLSALLQKFNQKSGCRGLFPYEGECQGSLREELAHTKATGVDEVWLFVGSEGGFSEAEVEKFRDHNMQAVSLGPQVLRVETACLALISILKYELELI